MHTHAGSASAPGNGRDEHRELCVTLNWGELFYRVLCSFLGLGGIKEGIRQSSCFSGQPACMERSIIAEMAGSMVTLMLSLRHTNSGCRFVHSVTEKDTGTEKQKTAN